MKPRHTMIGLGIALLAGCASGPVPAERVASAQAAIRSAQEVGAQRVPQATLHLQLAREQADYAAELIRNGSHDRAASVLMRAQADAELALALARQDKEIQEANQAVDRVRALEPQLQAPKATSGS